jgi:hypothetical protein
MTTSFYKKKEFRQVFIWVSSTMLLVCFDRISSVPATARDLTAAPTSQAPQVAAAAAAGARRQFH